MQIYEVFGTLKAMAKDPRSLISPSKFAQIQQVERSADAEQSAQKLRKQGYGQLPSSVPASQLISQVRNDRAAQQLINSWASQWSNVSKNIPAVQPQASAAAPVSTTLSQPITIGGQQLDPNNPADARIIAQLKAQGQLTEQQATPQQDPTAYRAAFVSWADQVIERTTRQSGAIARIKQIPNWANLFKRAADDVVNSAADPQQNLQAVREYMTVAIAAARAAHQGDTTSVGRAGAASGLNDPRADALARTLGIDATDVTKLNAFLRRNNETINPQGTGSESLDALLKAAKLLK
jgi:hypothetical protein